MQHHSERYLHMYIKATTARLGIEERLSQVHQILACMSSTLHQILACMSSTLAVHVHACIRQLPAGLRGRASAASGRHPAAS